MIIVAHRVNDSAALAAVPIACGVEVDVRLFGGRLVCAHDALAGGEAFETWLQAYRHALAVVNVKEEGLERLIWPVLEHAGVQKAFLLDQGTPFLVRMARSGERRGAVRVSDVEGEQASIALAGQLDWAWVDAFGALPGDVGLLERLATRGYRTCLVSPELHGRDIGEIARVHDWLRASGRRPDAVCTDRPDLWATVAEHPET